MRIVSAQRLSRLIRPLPSVTFPPIRVQTPQLRLAHGRPRMPRLYLTVFVAFVALLSACGLTERERAVSRVNEQTQRVAQAGQVVAEVIAELPESDLQFQHFESLREALVTYLDGMDSLNAAMRAFGEQVEDIQEHIETTFRPSSEAAASSCQAALDALTDEEATHEDYQRAITRIGQCLERYATAVNNVKAAHDRTAL